jgi:hypothetical protein
VFDDGGLVGTCFPFSSLVPLVPYRPLELGPLSFPNHVLLRFQPLPQTSTTTYVLYSPKLFLLIYDCVFSPSSTLILFVPSSPGFIHSFIASGSVLMGL